MKQINLAPEDQKKEVRFLALRALSLKVIAYSGVVLFLAVFAMVASIVFNIQVKQMALDASRQLESQQSLSDYGAVRDEVKNVNNYLSDATALFAKMPRLSKVTEEVMAVLPSDVTLQSLVFDSSTKQATLTGQSPSREKVIELHQNILKNTVVFKNVDYPLENLAKPTNVQFHYTVEFQEAALK